MTATAPRALGADLPRLDGPDKVTGTAPYAYEHPQSEPAYAVPLLSTVARGRVTAIDAAAAVALPGVLAVLTHEGAPRVGREDPELAILQDGEIHFRGQVLGAVIADAPEVAQEAAHLVRIEQEAAPHDVRLRADHPDLYRPEKVNGGYVPDTAQGDVDAALAAAAVVLDETYTTPLQQQHPMEPHTTVARWADGALHLHESTQSVHGVRRSLAQLFGLRPERIHVTAPYVGGGFGAKGLVHAPCVLAVMCAMQAPGRAVKLALTRRQMATLAGHRPPTISRVRLGAGPDGTLAALAHDAWSHTSRVKEHAEQTATPARMMYAAPARRTTHRYAPLDVPAPTWMRGPGETPGMFALECAMDELAIALGLDPIDLRVRNEPERDPETGRPWSSRGLVACLRTGAQSFGWEGRDPTPAARRDGRWLVGTGVAAATYPRYGGAGSQVRIAFGDDGRFHVATGAMDIGTGTWTAFTQLAAEALGVDVDRVAVHIGDTSTPFSDVPGGSSGITSWGLAVHGAARAFRERHGDDPSPGDEVTAGAADERDPKERFAIHAFGAQFAEVRVDADTGEVRVPRMLGVFAAGRIVNPRTARSQLIGGMTFGLGMALCEEGVIDGRLGAVVTDDLTSYHVASHADVGDIDARCIEEHDPHVGPFGTKGIGEIGVVGAAAAVANAVHHATGVRVRDLPITPDRLVGRV